MRPYDPILLVEDEPDAVTLLRHVFARVGILNPLHSVNDGEQATAYLGGEGAFADRATHPLPSLILLDLKIPRRSGLEVLQWIRTESHVRLVPVIMMTSSRERSDLRRAYAAGANAYIVKPSSLDQLTQLVIALRDFWLAYNETPARWNASDFRLLDYGNRPRVDLP